MLRSWFASVLLVAVQLSLHVSADEWVKVPPDYTFSMLSWGPPDYNYDDATEGHKVVFVDVDQEQEKFGMERFNQLKESGHILVCYFSAGTYEPFRRLANEFFDEDETRKGIIGEKMGDWDEHWLDISQFDILSQYLVRQMDFLKSSGCHAVEPDNIDCYTHENCVRPGHTRDDFKELQMQMNVFMADYAHSLGMAIAHKNNLLQIPELCHVYDFAIIESSFAFGESALAQAFLDQNKAVFLTEYLEGSDAHCEASFGLGMHMKYAVGQQWSNCFEAGEFPEGYEYESGATGRSLALAGASGGPSAVCTSACGEHATSCTLADDGSAESCECEDGYESGGEAGKCEKKSGTAKKVGMYVGIGVGAAALLSGLTAGAVFAAKKRSQKRAGKLDTPDSVGDIWDTSKKDSDQYMSAVQMDNAEL